VEEPWWHLVRIALVAMASPLVRRVEILEERVNSTSDRPDRVAAVKTELTSFRSEVLAQFAAVHKEFAAVRAEMRAGDEETRRYMRVLHEDVISRIALLQETVERSNISNDFSC
jgi:hypothetical protein